MSDQYISSRFYETVKEKSPNVSALHVNNFLCLMVDYLDNKGIIDTEDLIEFLDSQVLATKMQKPDIQEDEDWKFK